MDDHRAVPTRSRDSEAAPQLTEILELSARKPWFLTVIAKKVNFGFGSNFLDFLEFDKKLSI